MLSLRLALLIVSLFSAVTQSFQLFAPNPRDFESVPTIHEKRASSKEHNPLPCPPKGKKPKFPKLKDDGAKKGKLPYTAELIKAANEKHAESDKNNKNDKNPKRRSSNEANEEPSTKSLSKRAQDRLLELYDNAQIKVDTDDSNGILYNWEGRLEDKNIEKQIIATRDLSGCTVLVIASPMGAFMVHVWERRDESHDGYGWVLYPEGAEQRRQDEEFIAKGRELMGEMLRFTGGTVQNGFNGWFRAHETTVNIVAPAANPEYDDDRGKPGVAHQNPWYTYEDSGYKNPMRLIYKNAAEGLLEAAIEMVIPGRRDQAFIQPYRRRYSNDLGHGMDDLQYVVLAPQIMSSREVYLQMLYDSGRGFPIVQLA